MYVLGNVIALCSTGFLVGPKNQCKKMFDETRRWSAVFYLVMLITVFAVALAVRHPPVSCSVVIMLCPFMWASPRSKLTVPVSCLGNVLSCPYVSCPYAAGPKCLPCTLPAPHSSPCSCLVSPLLNRLNVKLLLMEIRHVQCLCVSGYHFGFGEGTRCPM